MNRGCPGRPQGRGIRRHRSDDAPNVTRRRQSRRLLQEEQFTSPIATSIRDVTTDRSRSSESYNNNACNIDYHGTRRSPSQDRQQHLLSTQLVLGNELEHDDDETNPYSSSKYNTSLR
mmetsp:Transcript_28991/g.33699  ORF Transcript_28991/g.33699 Transcript_28991/m.33699 type:complete len:118 (-) Transcript_28991:878-1231(-)